MQQIDYQELVDGSNREYTCGQCEDLFKSGEKLKHHMKTTHNLDIKHNFHKFIYKR